MYFHHIIYLIEMARGFASVNFRGFFYISEEPLRTIIFIYSVDNKTLSNLAIVKVRRCAQSRLLFSIKRVKTRVMGSCMIMSLFVLTLTKYLCTYFTCKYTYANGRSLANITSTSKPPNLTEFSITHLFMCFEF